MGASQLTLESLESAAERITRMSREEALRELHGLHCAFPLDFTPEYLAGLDLDALRHILMAALLHRRPRRKAQ